MRLSHIPGESCSKTRSVRPSTCPERWVRLRQTAAKKKALPLEVILGEELVFGAFDGLRTNPGELGERDFIAWHPEHIGRGFSVEWKEGEKHKVEMRLPLPSMNEEIKDFYETVRRIAEFWSAEPVLVCPWLQIR